MSSQPSGGPDTKRWIGLIIVGLVLGEAIWMVAVSLTKDILVPLMAMAMGGDTASPLSLGKPEFNFPDLFTAVLALCVAGIIAICLKFFVLRRPKAPTSESLSLAQASPARPVVAAVPAVPAKPTAAPLAVAPATATPSWATTTAEVSVRPTPLASQEPIVVPPQPAPAKAQPVVATQAPQAPQPQVSAQPPRTQPAATSPTAAPLAPTAKQAPPAPPKSPPKKPKEVYYNIVGERITPEDE